MILGGFELKLPTDCVTWQVAALEQQAREMANRLAEKDAAINRLGKEKDAYYTGLLDDLQIQLAAAKASAASHYA